MPRNEWVDIDLDYFNNFEKGPMAAFEKVLFSLPQKTRAFFFIDHHHVLPIVRRAIRNRWVHTPMTIFRVDAHHDYYYADNIPRNDVEVDCGNFGFRVPLKAYNRFVWVNGGVWDDHWLSASRWLRNRGKSAQKYNNRSKICWHRDEVGLVTITVSPDYQDLSHCLNPMLEYAAEYFGIPNRPFVKSNSDDIYESDNWEIRPRFSATEVS